MTSHIYNLVMQQDSFSRHLEVAETARHIASLALNRLSMQLGRVANEGIRNRERPAYRRVDDTIEIINSDARRPASEFRPRSGTGALYNYASTVQGTAICPFVSKKDEFRAWDRYGSSACAPSRSLSVRGS